ncbi:DUF397 domain-containing protein [Streptomyces sp. NPDC088554]|uniref:DUF397 domain-containing protein n=1 Tax=Streptomyces sp. NPDC088554 TaxID=3365865 RepID=UPI00380A3798
MSGLAGARWRKSSYSGGANDCVELAVLDSQVAFRDSKRPELSPLVVGRSDAQTFIAGVGARWRKSSYSGGANNCVELAVVGTRIAIRDSKCPEQPVLVLSRARVRAFITGIRER